MNTQGFVKRSLLLSSVLLLASALSPLSSHAEEGQVQGAMMMTVPVPQVAGAVEDSLKACLARIPERASAGQRRLAERTCEGEEGTRKAINGPPQF
jgi:hypothetical protein